MEEFDAGHDSFEWIVFFVSLGADLVHQVHVRDLLIAISLQLPDKFTNVYDRELRLGAACHPFYDLLKCVWHYFSIALRVTLLQDSQKHVLFSFSVYLIVK